jgi:hypothetical protein
MIVEKAIWNLQKLLLRLLVKAEVVLNKRQGLKVNLGISSTLKMAITNESTPTMTNCVICVKESSAVKP